MPPRVVLVTGVSRQLGSSLAGRLAAEPSVQRVVGVDVVAPGTVRQALLGRAEFVRADIRNPAIARVIAEADVDTVVHLGVSAAPRGSGGRAATKEANVLGAMQLLAACQQSAGVRRLVVKSTSAVYGSSSRDPAVFTEDTAPRALPRSGFARDAVEVEGYVRGFARRRPDVALTVLRCAGILGPGADSALVRYLSLPVVPTVLGHDPRIQLLHAEDALEVLRLSTVEDKPGIVNVGGDGVLLLSQALRRAGRIPVPVPAQAVAAVGRAARRVRLVDFSPEQLRLLEFGRVLDTTRLRTGFGYLLRYTTAETFDDFLRTRRLRPLVEPGAVRDGERAVLGVLRQLAGTGGGRG